MWEKVRIIVPIHSSRGYQGLASVPGGKEMKQGSWWEEGASVALAATSPSLSVSASLSHTLTLRLSQSLQRWEIFSWGQKQKNFLVGGGDQNPNMEDLKQQGILSQVSEPRAKRTHMRWGFNSAKREKSFSPCQFTNKKVFLGLGHFFFFYYLNSLLCICFLYWRHFLLWESVICQKERQRETERGREGQVGWGGRQTETNTRIQTTQQGGTSY